MEIKTINSPTRNIKSSKPNLIVIGGGIVGITIARESIKSKLFNEVSIVEKERELGFHSSSRNSGVIHAGFYYSPESKKAKFCADGNKLMRKYILKNSIKYNPAGKVVVSKNEEEDKIIELLGMRAKENKCEVSILDSKLINEYEPFAKTNKLFLWSPNTWSSSPKQVLNCLKKELKELGVKIFLGLKVTKVKNNSIYLDNGDELKYDIIVNASGGYALKLAEFFGLKTNYKILPFKGLYLKSKKKSNIFKRHIYPVPDVSQPFLGIHTTLTEDNYLKLGPTAIPALSPENYKIFDGLDIEITPEIIYLQSTLFLNNIFNFRDLAIREFKYIFKKNIIKSAERLTKVDFKTKDFDWYSPGIRAQLYDIESNKLENDIVIESINNSVHLLNSISPSWTCSFKTAKYVLNYLRNFIS